MLNRIRTKDTVEVVSGKDLGKRGEVLEIDNKKKKVLVKGLALISKHSKPKRQGDQGGIIKKESFIMRDKLMPVCSSCKKACRVGVKVLEGGKKARVCCRCKKEL